MKFIYYLISDKDWIMFEEMTAGYSGSDLKCAVIDAGVEMYSRAGKLFGHLNARRCDFNINIIIPTRKPPLSVRN